MVACEVGVYDPKLQDGLEARLGMWLGSRASKLQAYRIDHRRPSTLQSLAVWCEKSSSLGQGSTGDVIAITKQSLDAKYHNARELRIFGLSGSRVQDVLKHDASRSALAAYVNTPSSSSVNSRSPDEEEKSQLILYCANVADHAGDMFIESATGLYTHILSQMAANSVIGDIAVVERFSQLRYTNDVVTALQEILTGPDCNFGTTNDGLLCILTALDRKLEGSYGPSLLPSLQRTALDCEKAGRWSSARQLQIFAYDICKVTSTATKAFHDTRSEYRAVLSLFEYSRRCLFSHSADFEAQLASLRLIRDTSLELKQHSTDLLRTDFEDLTLVSNRYLALGSSVADRDPQAFPKWPSTLRAVADITENAQEIVDVDENSPGQPNFLAVPVSAP